MPITGINEVINVLQSFTKQMEPAIQAELDAAGDSTFSASQDDAPVFSGNMKDSGHVDKSALHVEVVYDADYSLFVHEGHMSRAGNPVPGQAFLEPHFQVDAAALMDRLKNL